MFFLPSYAKSHHPAIPWLPSSSLTILNAGSFLGRIIPPLLADHLHLGLFNTLIACSFLAGLSCFLLMVNNHEASTICFAVVYGFLSGGFVSLINPCMHRITTEERELGTRVGMLYTIVSFSSVFAFPHLLE